MVSANVYRIDGEMRICILPHPVNERLTFPQTIQKVTTLNESLKKHGRSNCLYIESVGYQISLVQQLKNEGIHAEAVQVNGMDKRSRLALTSEAIQSGVILFPRHGVKELLSQLVGFGVEKHDDLADAFSTLILQILTKPRKTFGIILIDNGSRSAIFGNLWDKQF